MPIPAGIKTVRVTDLPGAAERASRLIDSAVRGEESLKATVDGYTKKLQHDQDSLKRISDIIENLPKDASARDRASWSEELAGVKAEIADDQKHLELYQSAMEDNSIATRTLKFAGRSLGFRPRRFNAIQREKRSGRTPCKPRGRVDRPVGLMP